jgi:CheY-like chemotaxis protein
VYALIAEFDPHQAAIYRTTVETHRVEVVVVRDGVSAREVLHTRGAPVILICDLSLPQADGFTLIADLRRISPPDRTAILAFSAFPELRAAAWNLRGSLGISEVGDKSGALKSIEQTVAKALASVGRKPTDEEPGRAHPEEFLRKVIGRMSKAFRVPVVVLSIEMATQGSR